MKACLRGLLAAWVWVATGLATGSILACVVVVFVGVGWTMGVWRVEDAPVEDDA